MDSKRGYGDLARVLAGSRVGAEHRRLGRNGQDACVIRTSAGRVVLVVADGCSMGAASEVGAQLGAAWIAQRVLADPESWCSAGAAAARVSALGLALDDALSGWTCGLGEQAPVVARYFLFGFLGAVLDGGHATVFGAGDGVWSAGGHTVALDPGPDNAPAYPAYRLLPAEALESSARVEAPVVHWSGGVVPGDRIWVATDGAVPILTDLPRWLAEPVLWRNPHGLSRRLAVHERRLLDDTTIAALEVTSCG